MTPWPSDPPFGGEPPYEGLADQYIDYLTTSTIPFIENRFSLKPCMRIIAGYSLAGLFALYCPYRTDMFSRVVCASGSLWYDNAVNFFTEKEPIRKPDKEYISLGNLESKTHNSIISKVGENTRTIVETLRSKGHCVYFELNSGGHFRDIFERTAKGIIWALKD